MPVAGLSARSLGGAGIPISVRSAQPSPDTTASRRRPSGPRAARCTWNSGLPAAEGRLLLAVKQQPPTLQTCDRVSILPDGSKQSV
jgi:hypothetical protein